MTTRPGELITDPSGATDNLSRRALLKTAFWAGTGAVLLSGCGGNGGSSAARQPQSPAPRATARPSRQPVEVSGNHAWVMDFSDMQDGPVPNELFSHVTGTGPPRNWGTGEIENYTDRGHNSGVKDGLLVIRAFREHYRGSDYTSARLDSRGKFDFVNGKLEVTSRTPRGDGTWPAAWLLPSQGRYSAADAGISSSNEWAWGVNGELDIMEAYGNIPNKAFASVHNLKQLERSAKPGQENYGQQGVSVPGISSDFHTFGIVKTPDYIDFTLNGDVYSHHPRPENSSPADWPYDQPFGLLINLAMGGPIAGPIDNASGPWTYETQRIEFTPIAA